MIGDGLAEDRVDYVATFVCSVLERYYEGIDGRMVNADSPFNDQGAIAGEDGETIFREIAAGLSLDEWPFFERLDIRTYFQRDYGLGFLPLVLLGRIFWRRRKQREIEEITVRAFARRVVDAFGAELGAGVARVRR